MKTRELDQTTCETIRCWLIAHSTPVLYFLATAGEWNTTTLFAIHVRNTNTDTSVNWCTQVHQHRWSLLQITGASRQIQRLAKSSVRVTSVNICRHLMLLHLNEKSPASASSSVHYWKESVWDSTNTLCKKNIGIKKIIITMLKVKPTKEAISLNFFCTSKSLA